MHVRKLLKGGSSSETAVGRGDIVGILNALQVVFVGVYLLTPGSSSYLKQYNDLEAGLVGMNPRGDPSSAPLLDTTPPHADLPQLPTDTSGSAYNESRVGLFSSNLNEGLVLASG